MAGQHSRLRGEDRREQIISVAMGLFARQGFVGTTTRQIAEHAGVTEAIIFRHFPHKEDLYWAVLDQKCRAGGHREEAAKRLKSGKGDQEVFAWVAEEILRRNSEDNSLSRLLLFSALEKHELSHRFFRTYVARYYELLAGAIRRRIREGRFRNVDPLLAARGFLGMVVYHFQIQELFGGKRYQNFDIRQVSRTLANIWLQGMVAPRSNHQDHSGINGKRLKRR